MAKKNMNAQAQNAQAQATEAMVTPITTATGEIKKDHAEAMATIKATAEQARKQPTVEAEPTAEETAKAQAKAKELKDKATEQAAITPELIKRVEEFKMRENLVSRFTVVDGVYNVPTVTANKKTFEIKVNDNKFIIDKQIKATGRTAFNKAVAREVFDLAKTKISKDIKKKNDSIAKTTSTIKQEELKEEIVLLTDQLSKIDFVESTLSLKTCETFKLANLVACKVLNVAPTFTHANALKAKAKAFVNAFNSAMAKLLTDNKAELSKEEINAITEFKKGVKECFSEYAQEQGIVEKFPVSVGTSDLTDMYRCSLDAKTGKCTLCDEGNTTLEICLMNCYLRKIKFDLLNK